MIQAGNEEVLASYLVGPGPGEFFIYAISSNPLSSYLCPGLLLLCMESFQQLHSKVVDTKSGFSEQYLKSLIFCLTLLDI